MLSVGLTGAELALCVGVVGVTSPGEGLTNNQAAIMQGAISSLRAALANASSHSRGYTVKLEKWQGETLYNTIADFYRVDLDESDPLGEIPPYLVATLNAVTEPIIEKLCAALWPDSLLVVPATAEEFEAEIGVPDGTGENQESETATG